MEKFKEEKILFNTYYWKQDDKLEVAQKLQGAKNRVKNLKEYAKNNNIKADYFVSSEAGITNLLGEWIDINFVVVESKVS